jgi:hypothetical protein
LTLLPKLLHEHPDLIPPHSARRHQATLLHYVSANGIEGHRQKTPHNIVHIADFLLCAGADVNAIADVYASVAIDCSWERKLILKPEERNADCSWIIFAPSAN